MLPGPVRLRVLFARHRMGRAGCGVLRCCLASSTREAPETRPPPLRADARSSQTVKPYLLHPARVRSQQSPRWSAERRTSRVMGRKAPDGACGPTSLARRRVPLHPSACRRSAPLALREGRNDKPRRRMCLARTNKLARMPLLLILILRAHEVRVSKDAARAWPSWFETALRAPSP